MNEKNNTEKKLGVIPLAALVVSAMIGGGIFSLPQNMAQSSALLAVILAWVVTGIGMFFLANTFRILADVKPDAFYEKAAAWAVENGITNGTGNGTTFSPKKSCTRGQAMTFLYKVFGQAD